MGSSLGSGAVGSPRLAASSAGKESVRQFCWGSWQGRHPEQGNAFLPWPEVPGTQPSRGPLHPCPIPMARRVFTLRIWGTCVRCFSLKVVPPANSEISPKLEKICALTLCSLPSLFCPCLVAFQKKKKKALRKESLSVEAAGNLTEMM